MSELLKYLSEQSKPRTSAEIANALSISIRSVKNHVRDINALYHKKIVLSSRNGYLINSEFSTSLFLDAGEELPQTWEERASYIIKQLILEHMSQLDLFDLCDNLCISYSTIKAVISKMNKVFAAYEVEFVCANDHVSIKGTEKGKRKLISYIINEDSKTSFLDTKQLQESFTDIDIMQLNRIIITNFKAAGFYLNDFAAINLILHLCILIDRQMNGNFLTSEHVNFEVENKREEQLLSDLCHDLEGAFHVRINKSEQFEIYMLIKANASYTLTASKDHLEEIAGKEALELSHYYIEQINSLYLLNLSDEAFFMPFCLHLKNLLFRLKTGCPVDNPMTDTIKRNNPIIFDMAIFIGLDLMDRYHVTIPEDEIAFLAIHIGAEVERQNVNNSKACAVLLCPNYQNLCIDLANKLMLNFGNQFTLIGTVHNEEELAELTKATRNIHFKLLFTTIPVHDSSHYAVIPITPFDLASQYDAIGDALGKYRMVYSNHKLKTCFHTYFEKELFFVNPPACTDRDEILSYLCKRLYQKNYTNNRFKENVLKREYAATTAFGNIAIPHSVEMDAIKTSITIAISKKGFEWEGSTVYLVLLLAINKADKKNFRLLYESLISLFGEDSMIQKVRKCDSFEEFEALIFHSIDKK